MGIGYTPEKMVRTEKLPLVPEPITVKTALYYIKGYLSG